MRTPAKPPTSPGSLVQIGFNGMVEETFPAQLGEVEAIQVQADGRDDLCALYLQALADLWEVDEALNRDIVQLGMDLSQTRLSPAEQGAVAVAFGSQQGLPVLQNTWQELADQGYIDQENLVWEDGLFLSITEEDPQADQLTFTVQKWRSGLGAYFFTDCTAQQAKDGSWGNYTVGAEAHCVKPALEEPGKRAQRGPCPQLIPQPQPGRSPLRPGFLNPFRLENPVELCYTILCIAIFTNPPFAPQIHSPGGIDLEKNPDHLPGGNLPPAGPV